MNWLGKISTAKVGILIILILFLNCVIQLQAHVSFYVLEDGVLEVPWPKSVPVDLQDLDKFYGRRCIFTITNFEDAHLIGIGQPVLIRRPLITLLMHRSDDRKAFENQWVYAMLPGTKKLNCLAYETEDGVEDKYYPHRCSQYNLTEFASRSKPWGCEVTLDIFPPVVLNSQLKTITDPLQRKNGISGTVKYFKYPHIWHRSWRDYEYNVRSRMNKISASTVPAIHMIVVASKGWKNLLSSYRRQEMLEVWIQSLFLRTHYKKHFKHYKDCKYYKETGWEFEALNSIVLLVKVETHSGNSERLIPTSVEFIPVPTFVGMAKFKNIQIGPSINLELIYSAATTSWTRMWPWHFGFTELTERGFSTPFLTMMDKYECVDLISGSFRKVLKNMQKYSHQYNHARVFMHLWKSIMKNYTYVLWPLSSRRACVNGREVVSPWNLNSRVTLWFLPQSGMSSDGGRSLHYPFWIPYKSSALQIVTCSTRDASWKKYALFLHTTLSLGTSWIAITAGITIAFYVNNVNISTSSNNNVKSLGVKRNTSKIGWVLSLLKGLVGQRISRIRHLISDSKLIQFGIGYLMVITVFVDLDHRANIIYRYLREPQQQKIFYDRIEQLIDDGADVLTKISSFHPIDLLNKHSHEPHTTYWKNLIKNSYQRVGYIGNLTILIASDIWTRPGQAYGLYETNKEIKLNEMIGNYTRTSLMTDLEDVGFVAENVRKSFIWERKIMDALLQKCESKKVAVLLPLYDGARFCNRSSLPKGFYSSEKRYMELETKMSLSGFIPPPAFARMSWLMESGIGGMWSELLQEMIRTKEHMMPGEKAKIDYSAASLSSIAWLFILLGSALAIGIMMAMFETDRFRPACINRLCVKAKH